MPKVAQHGIQSGVVSDEPVLHELVCLLKGKMEWFHLCQGVSLMSSPMELGGQEGSGHPTHFTR